MTVSEFWRGLRALIHPDPAEPRRWRCNPLLITDASEVVVYLGRAELEYRPEDRSWQRGTARATYDTETAAPSEFAIRSYRKGKSGKRYARPGAKLVGYADGQRYLLRINGSAESHELATRLAAKDLGEEVD